LRRIVVGCGTRDSVRLCLGNEERARLDRRLCETRSRSPVLWRFRWPLAIRDFLWDDGVLIGARDLFLCGTDSFFYASRGLRIGELGLEVFGRVTKVWPALEARAPVQAWRGPASDSRPPRWSMVPEAAVEDSGGQVLSSGLPLIVRQANEDGGRRVSAEVSLADPARAMPRWWQERAAWCTVADRVVCRRLARN